MNNLLEIISGCDIARDNFATYVDSCAIIDLSMLNNYYNQKKKYADQLVLEDEFVGKTYQNLNTISTVLAKQIRKK